MDDWEKDADDPSLLVIPKPKLNINKWEGEDEDDVKDSWEDDEEKKDEEKVEVKSVKTKPSKSLADKIAEKERETLLEMEEKLRESEQSITPEEALAEKLRLQKVQEESDLLAAMDTFGVTERLTGIDAMNPTNKAEFTELADALSKKAAQFKNDNEFSGFIEDLVRNICVNLTSVDLQKVKKTVDNLYIEKQKFEKEKNKKGGKGKYKARLRIEGENVDINDYGFADSYDYDDFM